MRFSATCSARDEDRIEQEVAENPKGVPRLAVQARRVAFGDWKLVLRAVFETQAGCVFGVARQVSGGCATQAACRQPVLPVLRFDSLEYAAFMQRFPNFFCFSD